jgi:hypothetical protein
VCGAIQRLDRRPFHGALAIVDDDFDTLESKPKLSRNLIATDAHDLECLLLRSRALEAVLAEYGDHARIHAFVQQHNQSVREALLDRGLMLGKLRWLALRNHWPVDLKPLLAARFLDEATWLMNKQQIFAEAVRLGVPLSVNELAAAHSALPPADPWRVCRGHDLVDILIVGLKNALGKAANVGRDSVGKLLRQSLDRTDFASTRLHSDLLTWERETPPYTVLARY